MIAIGFSRDANQTQQISKLGFTVSNIVLIWLLSNVATQTIPTENAICLESVKGSLMKTGTNAFGKEKIVVMNKISKINSKNF